MHLWVFSGHSFIWAEAHLQYRTEPVVKIIITIHWWCNPSNRTCILKHHKASSEFDSIASKVQQSNIQAENNIIMRLNAIELYYFHFDVLLLCVMLNVFVWLSAEHRVRLRSRHNVYSISLWFMSFSAKFRIVRWHIPSGNFWKMVLQFPNLYSARCEGGGGCGSVGMLRKINIFCSIVQSVVRCK